MKKTKTPHKALEGDTAIVSRWDVNEDIGEKFEETPEGYLTGTPIVTRSGIFKYLNNDGTIRTEFRPPSEVKRQDSIDSLKIKSVTNNHPKGLLDKKTTKSHIVGASGSKPFTMEIENQVNMDGKEEPDVAVAIDMTVMDSDAIDEVRGGKHALSCGYKCKLTRESGIWKGEKYDYVQRDIIYNHIGIVGRGRAGDIAQIRLDAFDDLDAISKIQEKNMKTVVINGVSYEAEAEVAEAYNLAVAKIAELTAEMAKVEEAVEETQAAVTELEAAKDTLQDKLTEAEEQLEGRMDADTINDEVEKRMALLRGADLVGLKVESVRMDAAATTKLQIDIIKKVFPTANLEGKSPEYVAARFDAAIETMEERKSHTPKSRQLVAGGGKERMDSTETPEDARARMIANRANKNTEKGA